jgi:hypothetical protein
MNYIEIDSVTNEVRAGPFEAPVLPTFSSGSNRIAKNADVITGVIYTGGTFDQNSNTVLAPSIPPHASNIWNEATLGWDFPVAYPTVTKEDIKSYSWNEKGQTWDLVVLEG